MSDLIRDFWDYLEVELGAGKEKKIGLYSTIAREFKEYVEKHSEDWLNNLGNPAMRKAYLD